jgi:hypothetical protein
MECRRNFSNFDRFTSGEASALSCESGGVEARISTIQKAFPQIAHFDSGDVPRRKENARILDLEESRRSIEIKFGTYQSVDQGMDERDVLGRILNVRDKLLSLGSYGKSIHESPCSVFGS